MIRYILWLKSKLVLIKILNKEHLKLKEPIESEVNNIRKEAESIHYELERTINSNRKMLQSIKTGIKSDKGENINLRVMSSQRSNYTSHEHTTKNVYNTPLSQFKFPNKVVDKLKDRASSNKQRIKLRSTKFRIHHKSGSRPHSIESIGRNSVKLKRFNEAGQSHHKSVFSDMNMSVTMFK